ncbi:MAG: hypothetical protein V1722_05495 [Candidatus Micrarchaeota archaeon]
MSVSQPITRERIQRRLSLFRNAEGKETPLTRAAQVGYLHEVLRRSGKMESGNREAIAAAYRQKLGEMLAKNKRGTVAIRMPVYARQLVEAGYGKAGIEILKAQGHGIHARRLEKQIANEKRTAEDALKPNFLTRSGYPLAAAGNYLRAGELRKAVSAFQSGGAYTTAAEVLLERGKHAEAAGIFARERKPYLAVKVLEEGGKPNAAARLLKSLRENLKDNKRAKKN